MPFFSDNHISNASSSHSTSLRPNKRAKISNDDTHSDRTGANHIRVEDDHSSNSPSSTPNNAAESNVKKKRRKHTKNQGWDVLFHEQGNQSGRQIPLKLYFDRTSILEPSEIPVDLRYFFQLCEVGVSIEKENGRPMYTKCDENIIFLTTALIVRNLEMNIPVRVLKSQTTNQAVPCMITSLGNNNHLVRLVGLITPLELQKINDSVRQIQTKCESTDNPQEMKYYKDLFSNKGVLKLGYWPNHELKGYNRAWIESKIEDILEEESDPVVRLNYGLIKLILGRITVQFRPLERNSRGKMKGIQDFAFRSAIKAKTSFSAQAKCINKFRYSDLVTTIEIGSIEDLVSSYPNINQHHGDTPSIIIHLSGPKAIIRFPQLHLDVELNIGNISVIPSGMGNLLHYLVTPTDDGNDNDNSAGMNLRSGTAKRLVMICYTHRGIEEAYERNKNAGGEMG